MKYLLMIFCCLSFTVAFPQDDEEAVKIIIEDFLESFHSQDAIGIKKTVHSSAILQTIGAGKDGIERLRTEDFDDLIQSITSIPDSVQFQERIINYTIKIDGAMANVWTPYEFWLNNEFHHCGVNSFQLFKQEGVWKIIYLIDTRRTNDCYQQ